MHIIPSGLSCTILSTQLERGQGCDVPEKRNVLFLAAEAEPFVKIGGLGEVAGSLPRALNALCASKHEVGALQVEVRLVLPFHGGIQRLGLEFRREKRFFVQFLGEELPVEVLSFEADGVVTYFIHSALIPPDSEVYSTDPQEDALKYTFFSFTALQLGEQLGWHPHVVHLNDWHTALAAYLMRFDPNLAPRFQQTVALISLHNLPYMGPRLFSLMEAQQLPRLDSPELPEWARDMPLPMGLYAADHIVAVSPSYAREILTSAHGCGLEGFLRKRRSHITGILNGLDETQWNPAQDAYLVEGYHAPNLEGKLANKRALQEEMGLIQDAQIPLLAVVSRMDTQKGIDLIPSVLQRCTALQHTDWQLVVLGTGDKRIEKMMLDLEKELPQQVRVVLRFDRPLSHRIFAGADILLLPSRYEPCGLTQMIAMRYGCVPVAHAVGGLRDTIRDQGAGNHQNGYLFYRFTPNAFARALSRALRDYGISERWRLVQLNGMQQDFSWSASAHKYLELYQALSRARKRSSD